VITAFIAENSFDQRATGCTQEQASLVEFWQVHWAVGQAHPVKLGAKGAVAFQTKPRMIPAIGWLSVICAPRTNQMNNRRITGKKPMARDVLNGLRAGTFLQIEHLQKKRAGGGKFGGAQGNVINVHIGSRQSECG
jgi:hypothetical protein